MKKTFLLLVIASVCAVSCNRTPQLGKAPTDKVIAAMTLEERAHLVVGTGMAGFSGDAPVIGETKNIIPGAAGTTYPIERLGIPSVVLADGPAGLRINPTREGDASTYYCTHFPIGTLLACTWNTELIENVGKAIGNEVLEYGVDVLLAPAINIHRNPLCGRNFEYFSEDPVVTGKTAAAYVRGIQSNGVGTSVKHFAVNSQESNRMSNNARVSQRALREIYLKGFELAVKEGEPWTIMSSYNYINGTYSSENKGLLTNVLRDDWGYKGMVMTDWFGGKNAVAQMEAGNDMLQPGTEKQIETIIEGVKNGTLDEAVLDRNVKRVLELILKTPHFRGYEHSNEPDLEAHAAVTRQSATEGMVLLKNENNALPMGDNVKKISLFGCTSYDFIAGGTGSGNVNRAYTVSLTDGLKNAGYELNGELTKRYSDHIQAEIEAAKEARKGLSALALTLLDSPRAKELNLNAPELGKAAHTSDLAIITLGRNSGEGLDRAIEDFNLSPEENRLLRSVCTAFHAVGKKVIVVLNVGGVIETASWKNLPDAILLAWQPGQEGGNSVADVLSGKSSPSGKLSMTFPIRWEDIASSANFPSDGAMDPSTSALLGLNENRDITNITDHGEKGDKKLWDYTDYEEDIYVGYRYFDSFNKPVSYPFGYGLSYTTFEYSEATLDEDCTVSVKITNTGKASGKEVVELYVAAPNAKAANKPEKELKAYSKTPELAPGESAVVKMSLVPTDFASFDASKSAWVVDGGEYELLIGASSRDIRAKVTTSLEAAVFPTSAALTPEVSINTLTR